MEGCLDEVRTVGGKDGTVEARMEVGMEGGMMEWKDVRMK